MRFKFTLTSKNSSKVLLILFDYFELLLVYELRLKKRLLELRNNKNKEPKDVNKTN